MFLAKVTLEKSHINFVVPRGCCGSMLCCVMLCCEECPVTDVHSVLRCVILAASYVEGFLLHCCQYHATKYRMHIRSRALFTT